MAGTLDKKMSQLGSLTKKEAIQSNGALIGFAGQGNFTIKVDDLTDVYFGNLSTSWEDIARAQAAGKLVYLRFEIPGLITVVVPVKTVFPTLEKLNSMLPSMVAAKKSQLMAELDELNERLTEAGYDSWTESDIDSFMNGSMDLQKVNQLREVTYEDLFDAENYAEYCRKNFPSSVSMDDYIDLAATGDLNQVSSLDSPNINVDVDITIDSLARIGIGLCYRPDLPFVTPTYFAMGMPGIYCVRKNYVEEPLRGANDIGGIASGIFNGDVIFEVAVGMSVELKDANDPEGLVLDLGGTTTNMVIDAETLDASDLSGTLAILGAYAGMIDVDAIFGIINDLKVTITEELSFKAVMNLLRNGWEIYLVDLQGHNEVLIPGKIGYFGMGVEFSRHELDKSGAMIRDAYNLMMFDDWDGCIYLGNNSDIFTRGAIEIKDDMTFGELYSAASDGAYGVILDGYGPIWVELRTTWFCGTEAVIMTARNGNRITEAIAVEVYDEINDDYYAYFMHITEDICSPVIIDFSELNGSDDVYGAAISISDLYPNHKLIEYEGGEVIDVDRVWVEHEIDNEIHMVQANAALITSHYSGEDFDDFYTFSVGTDGPVDGEFYLSYNRQIGIDAGSINPGSSGRLDLGNSIYYEYYDESESDWIRDDVMGLLVLLEENDFKGLSIGIGSRVLSYAGLDFGGGYTPRLLFQGVYKGVLYTADIAINYNGVHEGLISVHQPVRLEKAWTSFTSEPDTASYTLDCMHKAMYNVALDNGTTTALTVAAPAVYSGALADELDKPIHQDEPVQAKCVITKDSTAGNTTLGITGVTVGAGPYTLEPSKKYVLDIFGPVAELHEVQ